MTKEANIPARILEFAATEEELVAWYLRGVLARTGGNQSAAQRVLAIDRGTVRRRMEKFGLLDVSRKKKPKK